MVFTKRNANNMLSTIGLNSLENTEFVNLTSYLFNGVSLMIYVVFNKS